MSLSELFKDLDPAIAGPLERVTEALREEIRAQIDGVRQDVQGLAPGRSTHETSAAGTSGLDALDELKLATAGIDAATDQAAILGALLEGAGRFSSRAAFILIRDEGQRCWGSLGFEDAGASMQGELVRANGNSAWTRIREGAGTLGLTADECAAFCRQFDAQEPTMGALLPLSLGEHVAGFLYADRLGGGPLNLTALQLLTFVAGQTLETLPVRRRTSTPTLVVAPATAAAPSPEATAAPEASVPTEAVQEPEAPAEPQAPAEPEPPAELEALSEPDLDEPLAAPDEETAGLEPIVEPEPMAEAETIGHAAADFATSPTDTASFTVDAAPEPLEITPEPIEAAPEPSEVLGAPTVEIPIPVVDEPVATEVAPEPPAPATDGPTSQVVPPADVLGPGWAFTTKEGGAEGGNEALHEEARRLARLLVTEIKLYNEEQVDQGRRSGDIYRRLQEDIDRSRQIFEDRIDDQIRTGNDYFRDALIRILAGGDESLLGM